MTTLGIIGRMRNLKSTLSALLLLDAARWRLQSVRPAGKL